MPISRKPLREATPPKDAARTSGRRPAGKRPVPRKPPSFGKQVMRDSQFRTYAKWTVRIFIVYLVLLVLQFSFLSNFAELATLVLAGLAAIRLKTLWENYKTLRDRHASAKRGKNP